MRMLDNAYFYCRAKVSYYYNRLVKEQAGGAELVATLIIIGIVMILAFAFKDKLIGLVKNIWNQLIVNGTESTSQSDVATTWN